MTTQEKLLFLKEQGITFTKIAKEVKCTTATLAQYAKGTRNISLRLEKDVDNAIQELINKLEVLKYEK